MASLIAHTLPRASAKQLVRSFASVATQTTRTTVLPNGITVATEENNNNGAATVGVWINAGSRSEAAHGAANLLQQASIKANASTFEKLGGGLQAQTGREQSFYATQANEASLSAAVDGLSALVQGDVSDLEAARQEVFHQQEANDASLKNVTFDHLHAMAFQGETLGRPSLGVKESVEALTKADVDAFKQQLTAERLVLVGAGNVDHDALVRAAEKAFGQVAGGAAPVEKKPAFTGSEIRYRDDVLPQAHIAYAVEGAAYLSEDYFTLGVMATLIGSWNEQLGAAANLSSRLSTVVNQHHLANSFVSFNQGYKDTGLWGLYAVSDNKTQLDDLTHFIQTEWARLSTSVTASEVERAKQQFLASVLIQLDSNQAVAQDIASQVLATGKRLSPEEIKQAINKISVSDVRNAGNKYLWDQELVVAGVGPIEGLTDYGRARQLMSQLRF
ncbi:Metalloenzyme, LuxS/M16 peptidase-like protein [Gongronella butleri]|nr:Metalloenzyme, LuxS/M16 peptidase-like protein [Gongronella butleri]